MFQNQIEKIGRVQKISKNTLTNTWILKALKFSKH